MLFDLVAVLSTNSHQNFRLYAWAIHSFSGFMLVRLNARYSSLYNFYLPEFLFHNPFLRYSIWDAHISEMSYEIDILENRHCRVSYSEHFVSLTQSLKMSIWPMHRA